MLEMQQSSLMIAPVLPREDAVLELLDPSGQRIEVVCRARDGYINVTALCRAGNREYKTWKRTYGSFIEKLSSAVHICTAELERYENHGNNGRVTWVHPRIAVHIAQWISIDFSVQVSGWVHELLVTGGVRLGHETPEVELMRQQMEMMQLQLSQQSEALAIKEAEIERVREEERAKAEAESRARWQRKQEVYLRIHEKSSRPGFIYMIKNPNKEGVVKIGLTESVERRLADFRTPESSLYCQRKWAVQDMEVIEKALHSFYKDVRSSKGSEWFYERPGLEEEIDGIITAMTKVSRAEATAATRQALERVERLPILDDETKSKGPKRLAYSSDTEGETEGESEAPPPSIPVKEEKKPRKYTPRKPLTWPDDVKPPPTEEEWRIINQELELMRETSGKSFKQGERMRKFIEMLQQMRANITININADTVHLSTS